MKIRVFEAFSGYGSQAIALKRLQKDFPDDVAFEFVGISEIEPNAIKAYQAIHGDITNYGDIATINWGGGQTPDFELFTYSFPCQDISNAGKQRGFAEGSGSRSSLLWECEKAIEIKRPKYLLMENVKALASKKFRPDFQRWIDRLSALGYTSYWQILNARNYGIPQNRERVFMVSIYGCKDSFHFPKEMVLKKRLRDIIEDRVDESYYLKPEQIAKIIEHCDRKVAEGCGFKTNFQTKEGISGCITTRYGGRQTDTFVRVAIEEPKFLRFGFGFGQQGVSSEYAFTVNQSAFQHNNFLVENPEALRKFTEREVFRLMDVPDSDIDKIQSVEICKTALYKLAGNSIVVNVLYHVFRKMFVDYKSEDI